MKDTKIKKKPANIAKTKKNDAIVMIQKMMRGWFQRLKFRILYLQNQLDTGKERTRKSMKIIKEDFSKEKIAFKKKMKKDAEKDTKKSKALAQANKECHMIIDHLRKENKKIREKTAKLREEMQYIKLHSGRVAGATDRADACVDVINDHALKFNKTQKNLQSVIPKYKEAVQTLTEAVEERQQLYMSEHTIKVNYLKTMKNILEEMTERSKQQSLVEEIMDEFVLLEEIENSIQVPTKVSKD